MLVCRGANFVKYMKEPNIQFSSISCTSSRLFYMQLYFIFDWSRSLNSWLTKSPWTWMSRMKFARDVSDESCHEPFSHHSSNLKILVKETSWVQSANIVKYAKESNVQFYAFFNNLSRHFYILLYVDISWSVNSRNLRSWELVS